MCVRTTCEEVGRESNRARERRERNDTSPVKCRSSFEYGSRCGSICVTYVSVVDMERETCEEVGRGRNRAKEREKREEQRITCEMWVQFVFVSPFVFVYPRLTFNVISKHV